jgi:hypothetical protein
MVGDRGTGPSFHFQLSNTVAVKEVAASKTVSDWSLVNPWGKGLSSRILAIAPPHSISTRSQPLLLKRYGLDSLHYQTCLCKQRVSEIHLQLFNLTYQIRPLLTSS